MTISSQPALTEEMRNRIKYWTQWASDKFKPRDWQGAALAAYKNSPNQNFVMVACPASGKTTAMVLCARHSIDIGEASFMIVLVTNGHLQKSFVKDANEMGVNLIAYSHEDVDIFRDEKDRKKGTKYTTIKQLVASGFHGIVMPVHILATDRYWQYLRAQLAPHNLPNGVALLIDEIHHYGDQLEKREHDKTPAFTKGVLSVFKDDVTSRRILGTGTPFRSDPRAILSDWIEYVDSEVEQLLPNGDTKTVQGKQMAVMAEGHRFPDICDREIAVVNNHGVVVSYGEHAVPMGWCPEVAFNLDDYKHNWDEELINEDGTEGEPIERRDITWAFCDAAKEDRNKLLIGCKLDAVKPTNGFVRDRLRRINDVITRDRHKGFEPRPDSACLVVVPGGGPNDNPESLTEDSSAYESMPAQYAEVIKQETGEDAWIIVGDMSKCRAGRVLKPLGREINGVTINQPSDLIAAFSKCDDRYVITQKMIAEGATIYRLDHVLYCGTDLTEMFLWQVLGRALRMYLANKVAYFWSYNHPVIRLWARRIKESLDRLKREEKEPGDGPEPGERIRRVLHNCSHDTDYEIFDGEEFQGQRLAVIKHWLARMRSSMPLGEAERYLRENDLWEAACRDYMENRPTEADEAPVCVVNAVLPQRLGTEWRELPMATRVKILKEMLMRVYRRSHWAEAFGDVEHSTVDDKDRERVFKRASAAYGRRYRVAQTLASMNNKPLDDALYPIVVECVTALKSEYGICHTTLNYRFPANA